MRSLLGATATLCLGTILSIFSSSEVLWLFTLAVTLVWVATWPPILRKLRPHRERRPSLFIALSALAGAILIGSAAALLVYIRKDVITVSPAGPFPLHSADWANSVTLSVRNSGEDPLYSVFVKVWTETEGVKSADIGIEPSEDNPHAPMLTVESNGSKIQIRSDVLMCNWIDKEKRQGVLVRFYELQGKATRHLIVKGSAKVASTAFAKVLEHKEAPDNVLTKPGQAGDYEPGNCRWATPKQQATTNRGLFRSGMIPWNKRSVEKVKGKAK